MTTTHALTKSTILAISRRDKLAAELRPIVGAFDSSCLTEADVASLGLRRLGMTAPPGREVATIRGVILAKTRAKAGTGMDATSGRDNFVSRHLRAASAHG